MGNHVNDLRTLNFDATVDLQRGGTRDNQIATKALGYLGDMDQSDRKAVSALYAKIVNATSKNTDVDIVRAALLAAASAFTLDSLMVAADRRPASLKPKINDEVMNLIAKRHPNWQEVGVFNPQDFVTLFNKTTEEVRAARKAAKNNVETVEAETVEA